MSIVPLHSSSETRRKVVLYIMSSVIFLTTRLQICPLESGKLKTDVRINFIHFDTEAEEIS